MVPSAAADTATHPLGRAAERQSRESEPTIGIIAPGAAADLVLLRGDPLADIHNTRDIELVVPADRRWNPAELLAVR
jgi:imidazolonepropionase-like amidohydrolase